MKQKKTKTRRSSIKNASLKINYNSRIRQEYLDMDYLADLNDTKKNCKLPNGKMVTELEYMAIFMKEWNNGEVGKQSEAKKNQMHRTAKEVKDCTDRNNSRNRDEYAISKARNLVVKINPETLNKFIEKEQFVTQNNIEDAMIECLDQTKELNNTRQNRKYKRKNPK